MLLDETGAEFPHDTAIKAGVSESQPLRLCPVNPCTDRFRGLPVKQAFGTLHDRDERQPPGRLSSSPAFSKQWHKHLIGKDGAEVIAHQQIRGERSFGDTSGVGWAWRAWSSRGGSIRASEVRGCVQSGRLSMRRLTPCSEASLPYRILAT